MTDREIVAVVLDEACLTLEQVASACAVDTGWVARRVAEGYFQAAGASSAEWRFTSTALLRARRMHAIERDFDAVPELAALVADMLEEVDELRARLRREGLG
jgi:chaperone modulatory protein CbpM